MSNKTHGDRIIALVGALAGVAVGAAVALIYSPRSGKQNRKNLSKWTQNRLGEVKIGG